MMRWQCAGGTILRTNLMDASGTWVLFDYNLAKSGNFDSITHRCGFSPRIRHGCNWATFLWHTITDYVGCVVVCSWTNIVLGVSRHSVVTYIDGILTQPTEYGFPRSTDCS